MMLFSRLRTALLHGTMLIAPALLLSTPGAAQSLAANVRPQGGQVVGGNASIAQTQTTTTITQITNRGVVDWRSFDVGRDHTVAFQQPSSSAMTLNRVTGPDPSAIAGRITANGGITLVNPSGVVFSGSAQVQAQSVIVSTADISNQAFMAGGRMSFDKPGKPDARIENNGRITVKQAGLAALVAPQVVNNGVIQARLGTVVLAGAQRHVIDMNGDGLVSFDITDSVRKLPGAETALVTNTGIIRAEGGTVLLTAAAADGILQTLVRSGGHVSANTDAGTGRTGQVLLTGTGGSIRIEGTVSAQGHAPDTKGGAISVVADRVLLASTARLNASGKAGGGEIAIGATLRSAPVARLAARTGIAAGAVVKADATVKGNGGTVLVNSTETTLHSGAISARGGPQGGSGGTIEVSGKKSVQFNGTTDTSAPAGQAGQTILDPTDLTVVTDGDNRINITSADLSGGILGPADGPATSYIGQSQINNVTGGLTLEAVNSLTVAAGINKPRGDLVLVSHNLLTINAPVLLGAGDLTLTGVTIGINALAQVSLANSVTIGSYDPRGFGTGAGSSITESGVGRIFGGTLTQGNTPFDTIALGGDNQIASLARLRANNDLGFNNIGSLAITGGVLGNTQANIDVHGGNLTVNGSVQSAGASVLRASNNITVNATASVRAAGISLLASYDFTGGVVDRNGTGGIFLAGNLFSGPAVESAGVLTPVTLQSGTGGIAQTGGFVQGTTLSVASGGNVSLNFSNGLGRASDNQFNALGPSNVAGNFGLTAYTVDTPGTLSLIGDIRVGGTLSLVSVDAGMVQQSGSRIFAAALDAQALNSGNIVMQGDNHVANLGTVSAASVIYRNLTDLAVNGPVTAPGNVSIAVAAGNLVLNGPVTATDGALTLVASGNIVLNPGAVVATAATADPGPLTLSAATPDPGFDVSLPGSITLAGTLVAIRQLNLRAGTGGITQTLGRVAATDMSTQSGGVTLLNGASAGTPNAIAGGLIGVSTAGRFVLDNGVTDINVNSDIAAPSVGLRTSGALILSTHCVGNVTCFPAPSNVNAGTGPVSLRVGSISFLSTNTITGGLVEIAPYTAVDLIAGDPAGTLVAGALMVNANILSGITSQTLRLGGSTFADTAGGATLTTARDIQLGGLIRLPGTLDLRATGNVSQAAPFDPGALTGLVGGQVQLTDPANRLGALGDFSAGGNFALQVNGFLNLAGSLSAPGRSTDLVATTGIAEGPQSRIAADLLTMRTAAGSIGLNGSNVVDRLGNSSAPGSLTFNDQVSLLAVPLGTTIQVNGAATITGAGTIDVEGTVRSNGLGITAAREIDVNGHSAIAGTGALSLTARSVAVNGLISAGTTISVTANSASLAGTAQGQMLIVTAPLVTFGGLDAGGMMVRLQLGTAGIASGALNVAGLVVAGGGFATLTGSIAGVSGEPAASLGRRSTATGPVFGDPPPNAGRFTFNNCPIGVAVCHPIVIPPPIVPTAPTVLAATAPRSAGPSRDPLSDVIGALYTVAINPLGVLADINPRRYDAMLTQTWFGLPIVAALGVATRASRDSDEDLQLAPPNVRAEDF